MTTQTLERVSIPAADGGRFTGYLAVPEGTGPWPGLLVLPEIYNANDHIRSVAAGFAAAGFLALAPDVYWRLEPETYLPYTEEGRTRARALNQRLDVDQLVADLGACLAALRRHPAGNGRVGVTGFCLGGKLTFLVAARHAVDAAVSYYGVKIDRYLDEGAAVTCPAIFHFAENDSHVPPEAVARLRARMGAMANVGIHLYPGAEHGFNRAGYPPYHEPSARLARERTLALFRQALVVPADRS